jgi:hypothetical protein
MSVLHPICGGLDRSRTTGQTQVMGKSRHGWTVLRSIPSDDGLRCVDFFEHGDYGFAVFRTDPEDEGMWTLMPGQGGRSFSTAAEAAHAAEEQIRWLRTDHVATRSFHNWMATVEA